MYTEALDPHESDSSYLVLGASQVALVVKNLPANAGDVRDVGLSLLTMFLSTF